MEFVHIADLHVGKLFSKGALNKDLRLARKKRQAIKENLLEVTTYCNRKNIDLLLITGDLFDKEHPEASDVLDVSEILGRLNKTKTFIIFGNHDPAWQTDDLEAKIPWPKGVNFLKKEFSEVYFKEWDLQLIGHSWQSKGDKSFDYLRFESLVKSRRASHTIAMIHGNLDQEGYLALDSSRLLSYPVDYYALGHIHKSQVIGERIAYPGSLESLDFSEEGQHGLIRGRLDGNGLSLEMVTMEKEPLKTYDIEISDQDGFIAIRDKVSEVMNNLMEPGIFRLRFVGYRQEAIGSLVRRFEAFENAKGSHENLIYEDQTRIAVDLELLRENHEEDLLGRFIRRMEEEDMTDNINRRALETGVQMLLDIME